MKALTKEEAVRLHRELWNWIAELKIGLGLEHFHNDGILKFFNPETGDELTGEQAADYISEKYGKH